MRDLRLSRLLGRRFQVDFAPRRPEVPPLSWLLLGVGIVALTAALADFVPRWLERAQLMHEREDLESRLDRLPGLAHRSARTVDSVGLAQAHGLLEQLDRPWPALFDQFEAADSQDVHLVQLTVDSRFRTMQLTTEASTLERVLQYSRQLPGNGPVQTIRLTHHEWRNTPSGRIVVADLAADLSPDVTPESRKAAR